MEKLCSQTGKIVGNEIVYSRMKVRGVVKSTFKIERIIRWMFIIYTYLLLCYNII